MSTTRRAMTIAVNLAVLAPLGIALATPGFAAREEAPYCFAGYNQCAPAQADATPRPAPFANSVETGGLQGVRPFVAAWREAIVARDREAAALAAENCELEWQAVEAWVNYRSVVFYNDIEPDTQFAIEKIVADPRPDWDRALVLIDRLAEDLEAYIAFAANGPELNPVFDDLARVRRARAYILVARDSLDGGDPTKARAFANGFDTRG